MRKTALMVRVGTALVTASFTLSLATPALAFKLEVPKSFKQNFAKVRQLAQEMPPPSAPSSPTQFGPIPSGSSPSGPVSGEQFGPPPSGTSSQFTPPPGGTTGQLGSNQFGPSTDQFGQFPSQGEKLGPPPGGTGTQFGSDQFRIMPLGESHPRPAGESKEFQSMKEGVGPLNSNLNKLDQRFKEVERRGEQVLPGDKEKLQRAKGMVGTVRRAKNPEELQDVNMEELEGDVQSLEQTRRQLEEEKRRLQEMKRGMLQMEKGLKMFEAQIARLAKQKIAVPAEVTETLAKIKAILAAVKAAKTFEEIEAAGIEEMPDLMQGLEEARQQLERLARWPQVVRQVSQQVKRLESELKRAKSTVERLKKQKFDLADEYAAFADAVKKLKDVVGVASSKVAGGGTSEDIDEAFEMLENDFFGQMEEAFQHVQVIQTMANLGRFNSDFRRGLAQAQQQINRLKRQKIDTTELQEIYNEAKAKGEEVLDLLKAKPIDSEAIQDGLQELESIRQQFEEKVDELTGEEETLPWEQGKDQFQAVKLSPDISKLIPTKQETAAPAEEPAF